MTSIEIVRPGPRCTVQDLGRPGLAGMGVTTSGAADRAGLRRANALVGNDSGDACLEITLGGLRLKALGDITVAVTGATAALTVLGTDGHRSSPDWASRVRLAAGEQLTIGSPKQGLRSYLAVAGGIDVRPVLGSRSTDTLSGIGPAPVAAGDVLPIGTPRNVAGARDTDVPDRTAPLRVRFGPREDWFTDSSRDMLLTQAWTVTADINRVGMKLSGHTALQRRISGELPSEGMVPGALQVPQNGQPVLFLADHPVTGGYPVIAVVDRDDVDRAAQHRPGEQLRFSADRPIG